MAVLEHDRRTCEERDQQFLLTRPLVQSVLRAVGIASAGLLLAAPIPLARDALPIPSPLRLLIVSGISLLTTELDTLWIGPSLFFQVAGCS